MGIAVIFHSCTGACTEDGIRCEGSGRYVREIDEMHALVGTPTVFAERSN